MIEALMIRQATKAGTIKWRVDGVADISFPTSKTRRGRVQGDGFILPTLMAGSQELYRLENDDVKKFRIRRLTPREYWRFMACNEEDFEKAEKKLTENQLYDLAGNAIVVTVLEAIFKNMLPK